MWPRRYQSRSRRQSAVNRGRRKTTQEKKNKKKQTDGGMVRLEVSY